MRTAKDKLIVALDVDTKDRALALFDQLRDVVGMFKIGSQLFTAVGPQIVREIVSRGGRIFLDLKFHDIPNTVAAAGIEATRLGVSIFNVHASGGREMMKRTADAVTETATREALPKPKVIAVTLLTSLDSSFLKRLGVNADSKDFVKSLAQEAAACGLDGVVASPQEISIVREIGHSDFLIVTPGIRSAEEETDDQRRTMNAVEAIQAGADYLVVGRPILKAVDPVAAAEKIVEQIERSVGSPRVSEGSIN
jgi:orotidine-5'-phosphate decarboxylase